MGEKAWVIFDARAWDDTDEAAVYCAYSDQKEPPDKETGYKGFDGYTVEMVKKERDEEWPDGVVFEYDIEEKDGQSYMVNQKLIG